MFNEPDDDYGRGQQIDRMVIVGRRLACGHRTHGLNTSSTFSANTQNTTMAGDTARITSINIDGVPTTLEVKKVAAVVAAIVKKAAARKAAVRLLMNVNSNHIQNSMSKCSNLQDIYI